MLDLKIGCQKNKLINEKLPNPNKRQEKKTEKLKIKFKYSLKAQILINVLQSWQTISVAVAFISIYLRYVFSRGDDLFRSI